MYNNNYRQGEHFDMNKCNCDRCCNRNDNWKDDKDHDREKEQVRCCFPVEICFPVEFCRPERKDDKKDDKDDKDDCDKWDKKEDNQCRCDRNEQCNHNNNRPYNNRNNCRCPICFLAGCLFGCCRKF